MCATFIMSISDSLLFHLFANISEGDVYHRKFLYTEVTALNNPGPVHAFHYRMSLKTTAAASESHVNNDVVTAVKLEFPTGYRPIWGGFWRLAV